MAIDKLKANRAVSVPVNEFRVVPGYPMYRINELGDVQSACETWATTKTWKQMHPRINSDGYAHIHLRNSESGKRKTFKVAYLVLSIFGSRRPRGRLCCFKNGNPADCKLSNLVWGTWEQSKAIRELLGHTAKGEKNGRSKLKAREIHEIRRYYDNPKNWEHDRLQGATAIAALYRVDSKTIRDIGKRRIWRHVAPA